MSEYLVISGLSGAGRSQAADVLEDLGWFVIDNLPPTLVPKVVELADAPGSSISRVALVVGTGAYFEQVVQAVAHLKRSVPAVSLLYLDCDTPELVRRYEGTRRRHPLTTDGLGLAEAIADERELLEPLRAEADVVIDTTDLNVHELRERIGAIFAGEEDGSAMQITIRSFGFKHGLPLDADLVFDVRFLPNPHWVPELRPFTGLDQAVRDHVLGPEITTEFLDRTEELIALLVPEYQGEGKSYLTIAVGCTGGRHRSVAVSEALAERLRRRGVDLAVGHRDVQR